MVSIRVLLEFERSIFIMKKVKEIVSQSEFCWSLRDHIINNKITSKFLSQSEFCWSLIDQKTKDNMEITFLCLNPSFVGV